MKTLRALHRAAGILLAAFLISSAFTGTIWGLSHHFYWGRDYLKPKQKIGAVDMTRVVVPPAAAVMVARSIVGDEAPVSSVTLRREADFVVYDVALKGEKSTRNILVDAAGGAALSPLSAPLAEKIARQYVKPKESVVTSTSLDEQWISRRNDPPKRVYVVAFSNPPKTEIVLDAESGKILEESDPTKRFHFFITRLHQLDFFGTDKWLVIIPGFGLLLMTITGVFLYRRRRLTVARA